MKKHAVSIAVLCAVIMGTLAFGGCSGSGNAGTAQNSSDTSTVSQASQSSDNSGDTSQDESSTESQDESSEESEKPSQVSIKPLVKDFTQLPSLTIDGVVYTDKSKYEEFLNNGWITYANMDSVIQSLKDGEVGGYPIQFSKPEYLTLKDDGSEEYDWQGSDRALVTVSFDLLEGNKSFVYSSYDDGMISDIFIHARNTSTNAVTTHYPTVSIEGIGIGSSKEDVIKTFGTKYYDGDDYFDYTYENNDSLKFHFSPDNRVNAIDYKPKGQLKAAQDAFRQSN